MRKAVWVILLLVVIGGLVIVGFYSRGGQGPPGYIEVLAPGGEIRLSGGGGFWGKNDYNVDFEKGQIEVAEGVYRPKLIWLETAEDGEAWRLDTLGPWGELAQIEVEPGKITELEFGPPLTVAAEVNPRGKYVLIDFVIKGQAGEEYKAAFKNGSSQGLPRFKVLDESGKSLATGQFEYG